MDNYEKKYKDALEWARKVMQGKIGFVLDEVLEKFPELKESEDDRIRKALIDYFRWNPNSKLLNEFSNREVFAYLEKQGKNDMGISEATKQKLEDNLNKALEKETPESCNEFLEKQGEQKPAWSEEDEKMMQYVIGSIDTNISDSNFKNIRSWFETIKERVQPQQKQEWSERDKEEFHIAIETLAEAGQNDSAHWLKSLKERYVWKPSDEQMAALNAISVTGVISDAEQGQELVNLYNVLRRLRENSYESKIVEETTQACLRENRNAILRG